MKSKNPLTLYQYNESNKSKTAFTRCRHILKTVKNVAVAKFEPAFTRMPEQFENVRNFDNKKTLHDFDAK